MSRVSSSVSILRRLSMSNSSRMQVRQLSRRIGKSENFRTESINFCDCSRLIQSGLRSLNRPLDSNSARPAFSRNRAPKKPELSSLDLRRSSICETGTRESSSSAPSGRVSWATRESLVTKISGCSPYLSFHADSRDIANGLLTMAPHPVCITIW